MKNFKDITLRRKLTIIQVVTAFTAVLMCCAFFVYNDIKFYKKASISNKNAIAEIVGINAASALEFLDKDAANEMLLKLKRNPTILNAVIFDKDGKEFSLYNKPGENQFSFPSPGNKSVEIQTVLGQRFLVSYPISDKEFLGTVMLRSEISGFNDIILNYIKIAAVILFASLVAALLVSGFLQRIITHRLLSLVNKTKQIAETGNYSIRASTEGRDEIGILSGAFNNMLDQIEKTTSLIIEKEKQYRFLLQNMREGIAVLDEELHYLFVNNAFAKEAKMPVSELLGHTMIEIFPDFENTEIYKGLQKALTLQQVQLLENEFSFPDGSKEWFELSLQPVPEGVLIHSVNITEKKQFQLTLQTTHAEISEYKNTLQNQSEALSRSNLIIEFDLEGNILTANDNFLELFGYSLNEIRGKHHSILLKEGQASSSGYREFWEILKKGRFQTGEFERKTKEGQTIWIHGSYNPIYSNDGKLIKILKIATDITEQKQGEERLKQNTEQLKNSNLELEHFAYIASHDLQEPLRMVSSFLHLLGEELEDKLNNTSRKYIDFAVDGALRMKVLVNDLLQYSRVGNNKESSSATDLNEVMKYVTHVLDEDIEKNKALVTVRPLPVIKGNKTLMSQLMVNLVSNALKYRNITTPEIEIGYKDEPDDWVFYVKDNGIGINPKYFDKIFIIFQRLHNKDEFSGTGIGLAICKKVLDVHQGKIWVESEEHIGSTFYFSIPKHLNDTGN